MRGVALICVLSLIMSAFVYRCDINRSASAPQMASFRLFVLKVQVNISQVYYLLPLDVNGSPGDDGPVSLGLHVVVQVRCALVLMPVDLVAGRQSAETVIPFVLFFILQAVVESVKLPALSFVHLAAQQDVMGGWHVSGHARELVAFLRQGAGVAFTVRVDWPVVVGSRAVLASFLASKKTGFVAISVLLAVARISMLMAATSHH